jgi:hypothetical protein
MPFKHFSYAREKSNSASGQSRCFGYVHTTSASPLTAAKSPLFGGIDQGANLSLSQRLGRLACRLWNGRKKFEIQLAGCRMGARGWCARMSLNDAT